MDLFGVWMEGLSSVAAGDDKNLLVRGNGQESGGADHVSDGQESGGADHVSDGQESEHFPCDDCCPPATRRRVGGKRGAGTVEEAILYA